MSETVCLGIIGDQRNDLNENGMKAGNPDVKTGKSGLNHQSAQGRGRPTSSVHTSCRKSSLVPGFGMNPRNSGAKLRKNDFRCDLRQKVRLPFHL